jgi:hypothetical protein
MGKAPLQPISGGGFPPMQGYEVPAQPSPARPVGAQQPVASQPQAQKDAFADLVDLMG